MEYWSYSLSDSERNYSATERECLAVVWAVRTLRPYVEGTKFTVRTGHDALRWLMSLTETSGRLTRWRLRLAENDFTIQYRPGRVHQVPDALSRLVSPKITNDLLPPSRWMTTSLLSTGERLFETYRTSSRTTFVPRAVIIRLTMSSSRHGTKPNQERGPAYGCATNHEATTKPPLSKDPLSFGRRTTSSMPPTSSAPKAPRPARPTPRLPHRRTTCRPL